jgi:hypothetical protein
MSCWDLSFALFVSLSLNHTHTYNSNRMLRVEDIFESELSFIIDYVIRKFQGMFKMPLLHFKDHFFKVRFLLLQYYSIFFKVLGNVLSKFLIISFENQLNSLSVFYNIKNPTF